jgi:Protein of unknown function (DUF4232)
MGIAARRWRLLTIAAFCAGLALLIVTASHAPSGGWRNHTITRIHGMAEASLSWEQRPDSFPGIVWADIRRIKLVLRDRGREVLDYRYPHILYGSVNRLTLRNVWADRHPEALVDLWTGGNRCCDELLVGLNRPGGGGRTLVHDFSTFGWGGERGDVGFEFVTGDDRFSCGFTDCASASRPIQILAIDDAGRRFVDVTRTRPDLIAADAAAQWKAYRQEITGNEYTTRKRIGYDPIGILAPWCADEYLLGKEAACTQALAQANAHGYLNGWHQAGPGLGVQGGRAVIPIVLKTLSKWGYTAPPRTASAGSPQPCLLTLKLGLRSEAPPGQFHVNLVIVNAGLFACRVHGWPDVELIGPVVPVFGSVYQLPQAAGRKATVDLRPGQSVHSILTWLPPAEPTARWVPGYVRVTVPTSAGPSFAMALPWRYGPVLRQDAATHPGTYVGPLQPGAGLHPTLGRKQVEYTFQGTPTMLPNIAKKKLPAGEVMDYGFADKGGRQVDASLIVYTSSARARQASIAFRRGSSTGKNFTVPSRTLRVLNVLLVLGPKISVSDQKDLTFGLSLLGKPTSP